MKTSNIIIGIILLALSCFYHLSTRGFPPPTVTENLGASFYPNLLIIVLIFLSLLLIIGSLFSRSPSEQKEQKASIAGGERLEEDSFAAGAISYKFLLGTIGLSTLYAVLLPFIGYITTTLLFILGMVKLLGGKQWFRNIAVSVILTAMLYFLFGRILGVPLPVDIFTNIWE